MVYSNVPGVDAQPLTYNSFEEVSLSRDDSSREQAGGRTRASWGAPISSLQVSSSNRISLIEWMQIVQGGR